MSDDSSKKLTFTKKTVRNLGVRSGVATGISTLSAPSYSVSKPATSFCPPASMWSVTTTTSSRKD